ncbi:MAG: biosynthetic arginine decarboxylase [Planctomycetes bacterium]|nr:biosynthetic arginine decarboxylase [Planctomycetota bacterium]
MSKWTHHDSANLYNIEHWGLGFFGINDKGHVEVHPDGPGGSATPIDMCELMGQLQRRGVRAPILMRFDGLLRSRVRSIFEAFDAARAEFDYPAPYRLIYPIKVNQEREVVESLLEEGRARGMGLEVGSKPELVAVMTLRGGGDDALVICNGYKDDEYIELALLSQKLGVTTIVVIEKITELDTVLRKAKELDIEPVIGVRTKLGYAGSGRWKESGGDRSKFGLTTGEIVEVVRRLDGEGMLSCLRLLHFHLGSQITNIRSLKMALREATHTLTGLSAMGVRIDWLDVGGGLGVDYDGSRTNFDSSMNYSLQEYASDIVYHVGEACREAEIPMPTLLSESGRALSAHHAVLVTEVLGTTETVARERPEPPSEDEHELIWAMSETAVGITRKTFQEAYHDLGEEREQARMLFNTGQLSMLERARIEEFYWYGCARVMRVSKDLDYVPDELENLERDLSDTFFLNFSLFQSLPDSWAIGQLFPIMPIDRLNEEPTRRATLADITCDSDGKIDRFINRRDVNSTLELHTWDPDEPYYIGFFLIGAYQEILGDMHNLFGDTNIVHVDVDDQGRPRLRHVVRGDRVQDVLAYVEYFEQDLLRDLRRHVEASLDEGLMTYEESALVYRRFEKALQGYTYLSRQPSALPAPTPTA